MDSFTELHLLTDSEQPLSERFSEEFVTHDHPSPPVSFDTPDAGYGSYCIIGWYVGLLFFFQLHFCTNSYADYAALPYLWRHWSITVLACQCLSKSTPNQTFHNLTFIIVPSWYVDLLHFKLYRHQLNYEPCGFFHFFYLLTSNFQHIDHLSRISESFFINILLTYPPYTFELDPNTMNWNIAQLVHLTGCYGHVKEKVYIFYGMCSNSKAPSVLSIYITVLNSLFCKCIHLCLGLWSWEGVYSSYTVRKRLNGSCVEHSY